MAGNGLKLSRAVLSWRLFSACADGDVEGAKRWIDQGAYINIPDPVTGSAPLHIAAQNGHMAIVDLLASHGADLEVVSAEAKDEEEEEVAPAWTPIMVCYKAAKMVEKLLVRGANPDFQDANERMTALHLAARDNCVETVMLLLRCGARRDLVNADGHTPLQEALAHEANDVVAAWQAYEASEQAAAAIRDDLASTVRPL